MQLPAQFQNMKILDTRLTLCVLIMFLSTQIFGAQVSPEKQKIYEGIIKSWNESHNNWHFKDLEKLYSEKVLFYCSTVSRQECISYKTSLASPTKVFEQHIASEIKYEALTDDLVKCGFLKEVFIDDKKADYPSYLVLKDTPDGVKIICESDEITDASFGFELSAAYFNSGTGEPVKVEAGEREKKSSGMFGYLGGGSAIIILIIALAARRRKKAHQKNEQA